MSYKFGKISVVAAATIVLFIGCGGGGGSSSNNDNPDSYKKDGNIVDGTINGATVSFAGQTTTSGQNGKYSMQFSSNPDSGQMIVTGGIDESTGKLFEGELRANVPEGQTTANVTPLTTIVANYIENNPDDNRTKTQIETAFANNLGVDVSMMSVDPITELKNGNVHAADALKALLKIQKTVEVAAKAAIQSSDATAVQVATNAIYAQIANDINNTDINTTLAPENLAQAFGGTQASNIVTSSSVIEGVTTLIDDLNTTNLSINRFNAQSKAMEYVGSNIESKLVDNNTSGAQQTLLANTLLGGLNGLTQIIEDANVTDEKPTVSVSSLESAMENKAKYALVLAQGLTFSDINITTLLNGLNTDENLTTAFTAAKNDNNVTAQMIDQINAINNTDINTSSIITTVQTQADINNILKEEREKIDRLSFSNLMFGEDVLTPLDGLFDNGEAIIKRKPQYTENNESYTLSFNIADALDANALFENNDSKALNIGFEIFNADTNETLNYVLTDVNVTKGDDYNITSVGDATILKREANTSSDAVLSATSMEDFITVNNNEVTINTKAIIENNATFANVEGIYDYALIISGEEFHGYDGSKGVFKASKGMDANQTTQYDGLVVFKTEGKINMGNTDYDKVQDTLSTITNSLTSSTSTSVTLPTGRADITWESNDTSIMNDNGVLTSSILDRLEAQTVQLTATSTSGDESDSTTVNVTVNAATASQLVSVAKDSLSLASEHTSNIFLDDNITEQDIDSNAQQNREVAMVTWTSSNTNLVSDSGVINTNLLTDQNATLEANITSNINGNAWDTKDFNVTIKANDNAIIAADYTDMNVTVGVVENNGTINNQMQIDHTMLNDINSTLTHFILPTMGTNGSTISWESNDTSIVSNDGNITGRNYMDQNVTLTATFESNATSLTAKAYDINATILKYTDAELVTLATQDLRVNDENNDTTIIISSDLALDTYNPQYDVNITWSSSNDSNATFTDENNNTILRTDAIRSGVNLHAYLFRNDMNATKDFNVTINASDDFIIAGDYADLNTTMSMYSDMNSTFASDVNLTSLANLTSGTTVAWSSSDVTITDGVFNSTPSATDRNITVTADINRAGTTTTYSQDYLITLLADPDMQSVALVQAAYDNNYTGVLDSNATVNGVVTIPLQTGNDADVTVSWTDQVDQNFTIETTTEKQTVSLEAVFAKNDYNVTSTYTYTIPADTNRTVSTTNSTFTTPDASVYYDTSDGAYARVDLNITLKDGYGNILPNTVLALSSSLTSGTTAEFTGFSTVTCADTEGCMDTITEVTTDSNGQANFVFEVDDRSDSSARSYSLVASVDNKTITLTASVEVDPVEGYTLLVETPTTGPSSSNGVTVALGSGGANVGKVYVDSTNFTNIGTTPAYGIGFNKGSDNGVIADTANDYASYDITVDPNIGYANVGATFKVIWNDNTVSTYTLSAGDLEN